MVLLPTCPWRLLTPTWLQMAFMPPPTPGNTRRTSPPLTTLRKNPANSTNHFGSGAPTDISQHTDDQPRMEYQYTSNKITSTQEPSIAQGGFNCLQEIFGRSTYNTRSYPIWNNADQTTWILRMLARWRIHDLYSGMAGGYASRTTKMKSTSD